MSSKSQKCIRCHPPGPDDPPLAGTTRYICDGCMDRLRHPRLLSPRTILQPPPSQPDGRKLKPSKGRKGKAVATALALLLLPLVGCTLHRNCTLDVNFDPRGGLQLPPPETALEISTAGNQPTES